MNYIALVMHARRCVGAALAAAVSTHTNSVQDVPGYWEVCGGIYSSNDWHSSVAPQVEVESDHFIPFEQFAMVLYAHEDRDMLGVTETDGSTEYVCTNSSISRGVCTEDDYGKVLIDPNRSSLYPIYNERVDLIPYNAFSWKGVFDPIVQKINHTAFYCVATVPVQYCDAGGWGGGRIWCHEKTPAERREEIAKFRPKVSYRNSFGYLQASKIPLIPFHFVLAILYFLFTVLWLCKSFLNRQYLLSIQYHVALLGSLTACEQLIIAVYLRTACRKGEFLGFLWFVATATACRVVYTLFLALIFSLGYSVVWQALSWRSLLYWAPLAAGTFATLLFYTVDASYTGDGIEFEFYGVIVISVLAVLLLLNFLWIMFCVSATQAYLFDNGQLFKANIYKQMRRIILVCGVVMSAFIFYCLLYRLSPKVKNSVNECWKYKWILSDGWPNTIYLFFFISVAYYLQPTSHTENYATSKQVPQDEHDEEYEIDTLNVSQDDDEFGNLQGHHEYLQE